MTLYKRISLKYWLDEPFWTTISSLNLSLKVPDCFSLAGCAEDVVFFQFQWPEVESLAQIRQFSVQLSL
jgi:hypothetical protein